MAAVLGFAQYFTRFRENGGRDLVRAIDGTLFCQKIDFVPIFPGFKRLAADLPGKTHAETLLDMEAYDLYASPAGEIRALFP